MKESLEKLAAVALLGTHKVGAIPPLDAPGRLAESLAKLAGRDPERHLLDAAAIIATAGRAGFVAPRITPPSETIVAPPEPHPVCPPAAAATLRRILSGEHADLLDQWLRLAADRNLLAPPDALPDLLTAAKNKPDLRATAAGVIGERGRWLARQNPDWAFASGADDADDAEERWRPPWGRDLSLIGAAVEPPKGGHALLHRGVRPRRTRPPPRRRRPSGRRPSRGHAHRSLLRRRSLRQPRPRSRYPRLPPSHAPGVQPVTTTMRLPAEQQYLEELQELRKADDRPRPPNWQLSPWAVVTYLTGGTLDNGFEITPKYIGNRRLMEIAVATLATDRTLLLLGVPGTAKTWVSEHLAAAISGNSTLLVQGTAGTAEEAVRYGWNYALLLSKGPTREALVPSPVMRAMEEGKIARVEELTRIPSEVQDTFITILSEKTLPVHELDTEVRAVKGFNVIATANDRDRGVNDLSSALKRRFNTVVLPVPETADEEVDIVRRRATDLGRALELPGEPPALEEIRRVVTVFRELREGKTADGKTRLKSPSGVMSTAEAISVVTGGLALAGHFGDGRLSANDLASGLVGAVVKDPVQDRIVWQEYLETVVKERDGWKDLYRASKELL